MRPDWLGRATKLDIRLPYRFGDSFGWCADPYQSKFDTCKVSCDCFVIGVFGVSNDSKAEVCQESSLILSTIFSRQVWQVVHASILQGLDSPTVLPQIWHFTITVTPQNLSPGALAFGAGFLDTQLLHRPQTILSSFFFQFGLPPPIFLRQHSQIAIATTHRLSVSATCGHGQIDRPVPIRREAREHRR